MGHLNHLAANNSIGMNSINNANKSSPFPAVPGYPYNSPFFPPAYFMYNGQLIPGPGHPDNIGNPQSFAANNFAAATTADPGIPGPQFGSNSAITMANSHAPFMPPNTGFNPFSAAQSNANNNNNIDYLHQNQGQSPQLGHSILDRKNTT